MLLGLQRPLFVLRGAVKLLQLERQKPNLRDTILGKFENEARVLAQVRHENVVRLLQYGRCLDPERTPFLVMEFIAGARTLTTETGLRGLRQERFELATLRRIVTQLGRALDAVHKHGLIHRDLKPDTIMLEEVDGDPWHVKLIDFGLAKSVDESTDTRYLSGSPAYMAPTNRSNIATSARRLTSTRSRSSCSNSGLGVGSRRSPASRNLRLGHAPLDEAADPRTPARRPRPHAWRASTCSAARSHASAERALSICRAPLRLHFRHNGERRGHRRSSRTNFSGLVDPEDLSDLKREAERLEHERNALAAEVARLEGENRRISSLARQTPPARETRQTLWVFAGAISLLAVALTASILAAAPTTHEPLPVPPQPAPVIAVRPPVVPADTRTR